LVVGVLILLSALPAHAQRWPDVQLFAPADVSPYGSGIRPPEGYFFSFDYLRWSISSPETSPIGFPGLTRNVWYGPADDDMVVQTNTHDTSPLEAVWKHGQRIEFGHIQDRRGWLFSTYRLNRQTQNVTLSEVDVVMVDPEFGPRGTVLLEGIVGVEPDPDWVDPGDGSTAPLVNVIRNLPLTFDNLLLRNEVETWSVELMYVHRFRQRRHRGYFEMFLGPRYLEFDELFRVTDPDRGISGETGDDDDTTGDDDDTTGDDDDTTGDDDDTTGDDDDDTTAAVGDGPLGQAETGFPTFYIPPILDYSTWSTTAENRIVGGQIGARWVRQSGRWILEAQGRYMAGLNVQNIGQTGVLGDQLKFESVEADGDDDDDDDDAAADGDQTGFGVPRLMRATSFTHEDTLHEFSNVVELRAQLRYQFTRAVSLGAGWTGIWMDGIARPSSMINYEVPDMGLRTEFNRQDVFTHGFNFNITVNH
jgi:hypothetical protein